MMRSTFLALALFLAACGGSSAGGHLEKAQAALTSNDFAGAAAAAKAGLADASADPATKWRLELLGLEAKARGGKAEAVLATLERLAGAYPKQVNAKLYVSTANQLAEADQGAGAIELLHAGDQRYPDDGDIDQAIAKAMEAGGDDELEALKSLGYLN